MDLEGFGNRRPNELSGGQLQRVAIARALVKNPDIIMADEPTGALDSNTSKQIFDTLKKLSKNKLVIIVSHDREFSELYADRIIELADGKVISDVEYVGNYGDQPKLDGIENSRDLSVTEEGVIVPKGYRLSEDDRIAINEYLLRLNNGSVNVAGEKRFAHDKIFKATREERIEKTHKSFDAIRSKLPMKNAFRIGVSSLNHKKFRLVITILLSVVAFSLFGIIEIGRASCRERVLRLV